MEPIGTTRRRWREWASYVGDTRYGDRLADASPAATAAAFAATRETLDRAQAIPRDALGRGGAAPRRVREKMPSARVATKASVQAPASVPRAPVSAPCPPSTH